MVPPQITPRFSPDISKIWCSEAKQSNWMGESLMELLSKPLEGAGLGDRVRSVDSPSCGRRLSRDFDLLCFDWKTKPN